MIRKMMLLVLLLGTVLISSCASDYSRPPSYDEGPLLPYTYRDYCGMGAVYCGPGP